MAVDDDQLMLAEIRDGMRRSVERMRVRESLMGCIEQIVEDNMRKAGLMAEGAADAEHQD